jgi:hypothetical protein
MKWLGRWSLARRRAPADSESSLPSDSIVDEFIDSYVFWREACEEVRAAYKRWDSCKPPDRTLGFNLYRAALNREGYAARIHSHRVEQLRAATGSMTIRA